MASKQLSARDARRRAAGKGAMIETPSRDGPSGALEPENADAPHRYEVLARFVTALIDNGTLRPGMRAPSLRDIAARHDASLSTAIHAYRLLEDRGLIEARPKSGFFIAAPSRPALEPPARSRPPRRASHVTISGSVQQMLKLAGDPAFVPLGCALPSAKLLAAGRLDRFLARAARLHGAAYNEYLEPRGLPDLRTEISRRAARWGQALSPDDIVITNGCTEALALALRAVTRQGDTVAIESPTYFGVLQVFEALGLKALELPTDAASGIDIDALAAALKAKSMRACLFASNFNNPLGALMSDDKKRAILDLLAKHHVPLIEDDVYGDIYTGKSRPRPFVALRPDADIIYCNSFSKTLAPGYRVGWVAAPNHVDRILKDKFSLTLCGPALPQVALAAFLSSGGYDSHLRRLRRTFADNIDRMTRAIDRVFPQGTRVTRPAGGFVLWLELPPGCEARTLFEEAIARGVSIAPGDVFTAAQRYRNCIRLSCGDLWGQRIEEGVRVLGELATDQLARITGT